MSELARDIEPAEILLSVNNIEVVYDEVILVLRGVSLEVPKGQIVTLLGANGAGNDHTKSHFGFVKTEDGEVTRGEINFMGERIDNKSPEEIVRSGIFQVMEGRRIVEDMTVIENLRLGRLPATTTRLSKTSKWCLITSSTQRTYWSRGLLVGRRAADAGNRPGIDGAPENDLT